MNEGIDKMSMQWVNEIKNMSDKELMDEAIKIMPDIDYTDLLMLEMLVRILNQRGNR